MYIHIMGTASTATADPAISTAEEYAYVHNMYVDKYLDI